MANTSLMKQLAQLLLIVVVPISMTQAAKILIVPAQMKSHMMYLNAAGEGLLERGHEVYTLMGSHFPEPTDLIKLGYKILRFQVPAGAPTFISEDFQQGMLDMFITGKMPEENIVDDDCMRILDDSSLMQRLRDIKFDIAIVDGFPMGPCNYLIPHTLGIPYVSMSTVLEPWLVKSPALPSFVPMIATTYTEKMCFTERLINLLMTIVRNCPYIPGPMSNLMYNHTLVEKYSRDPAIQTWKDLASHSEIFFITRGPLLEWPTPTMPNSICLEGMTAKPPEALPPGELQQFVDGAQDHIIIVSFGSIFGTFPDPIFDKLISAFGQRKEHIIWRVPKDKVNTLRASKNVKMISWLPQNDLLGHPKTRLFITHGGNNGQYEALYHGVPMLGFPLFADQHHNAARMVSHKFGISGDIKTITASEIVEKIEELMTDSTYYDSIKKASKILRSSPMDARQTVTYWTEHVMKFGSQHLRSYAMDMPWYQYLMLDIALFLIMLFVITIICMKWACKLVCRKTVGGGKGKEKVN